ncbi:MAG: hypothetical protein IMZ61_10920 [Planctomycetes bacterium]|nr:hypothetical protein [Planctomycetota bacterium]
MAGKKGRSGRKRMPEKDVKEAIEALSADVPQLFEKLKVIALGLPITCPGCGQEVPAARPDKDSLIYLIDRVLGRPRQEIDARIKATHLVLSADDYELATRTAVMIEQTALESVSTNAPLLTTKVEEMGQGQ